ncbi:hypothetical protein H2203_002765 [Taxawa tesnikishii (nom. ined.)]|nr:hypothetical protein H2203_002765 [Dothideales sp. JES 119]
MTCNYDAPPGATRVQVLKDRNKELENTLHVALQVLDELRISSLPVAEDLLGRIRAGRDVQELLRIERERLETASNHTDIRGCLDFGSTMPNASPNSSSGDEAGNDSVVGTNRAKVERFDTPVDNRDAVMGYPAEKGPVSDPQDNRHCASSLPISSLAVHDTNEQYTAFVTPANFGNLPFSSAIKANGMCPDVQARQVSNLSKPEWSCESLLVFSDDPISQMIQGFHRKTAEWIAQGISLESILGQSGLLRLDPFVVNKPYSDIRDVQSWAANFAYSCVSKPTSEALVTIRGAAVLMARSLLLSKETYAALPEWAKPTPLQQYVPHPAWIDYVPFPQLRDYFINHLDLVTSLDWLPLLYQTFKCSWNFPMHECIYMDGTTRHTYLNPYFERHISDSRNFSLGAALQQFIPQLAHLVPVRDEVAT